MIKAMFIVFFYIEGVIMGNWVPDAVTENRQILKSVQERVRSKWAPAVENWFTPLSGQCSSNATQTLLFD